MKSCPPRHALPCDRLACYAGRVPFKHALDAMLKMYRLAVARNADQNASSAHEEAAMPLAFADAFLSAANMLSSADEPVRCDSAIHLCL